MVFFNKLLAAMPRCLLSALLLGFAAHAQQLGSVQGKVISQADRQPVRKAAVTLTSLSRDRSYAVAITDSTGSFTIPGLPQGRYRLAASHTGFISIPYGAEGLERPGAALNLAAGENRTGIALMLAQANSVRGTVTDPEGDGISGVQIKLYRKRFDRGKPGFAFIAEGSTDLRGHYELEQVTPGEYWVSAEGVHVHAFRTRPVAVFGERPHPESAGSQFFPAADSIASASPVAVLAGRDTTGIDFHLTYAPQVAFHGTVSGVPEEATRVMLSLEADSLPGSRTNVMGIPVDPAKHSFQVPAIAAGSYRLVARAGSRVAAADVRLQSPDTEVNIALVPGVPIEGAVLVEGPDADSVKIRRVSLSTGDDAPSATLQAEPEDGEFVFEEVPPGIWDIGVSPLPRGAYIKSMRLGGKDVLIDDMKIGPDSKGPLNILISTAAPKVEGTVEPAGPVTVLAAPTGSLGKVFSFFQTAQAGEKGSFRMDGLSPGTYRFYAFRSVEPNAWQDPAFLPPFESQSKLADLKEGGSVKLSLPVIEGVHP